jgi:hypothetical protein
MRAWRGDCLGHLATLPLAVAADVGKFNAEESCHENFRPIWARLRMWATGRPGFQEGLWPRDPEVVGHSGPAGANSAKFPVARDPGVAKLQFSAPLWPATPGLWATGRPGFQEGLWPAAAAAAAQ